MGKCVCSTSQIIKSQVIPGNRALSYVGELFPARGPPSRCYSTERRTPRQALLPGERLPYRKHHNTALTTRTQNPRSENEPFKLRTVITESDPQPLQPRDSASDRGTTRQLDPLKPHCKMETSRVLEVFLKAPESIM